MTASALEADSRNKVRRLALLATLVAAGFALRAVNIDRWPLWGDEALTLLIAQWSFLHLFLVPIDPTPGFYYALHKILLDPTVDAATARYISLACGTLLIPATYVLARETRVPALLTAAVVALSFPLIDYSQEARAYALLVLLVTLSAIFFVRWSRSRSLGDLLATLGLSLLAFYTHLVSIFWIGPICVAVLWIGRRQAFLPLLLFALLAIPEIRRLFAYKHSVFSWLGQATPIEALETLSRTMLPFRPVGVWAAAIALILAWRIWAHRKQLNEWVRANPVSAFAVAVLFGSPVLVWAFGLVAKPIFMTRTILIAVPGFMLALALLLHFEHRLARFGVVALYAASLLVTGTTRQKDDWLAIANRVGSDPVLMCQLSDAPAMRHALARENKILLRYDQGLIDVRGTPWPRAYFEVISRKRRLPEAKLRGNAANLDSYPVWPVRSGQVEQMESNPATLRQAIAYCDSVRIKDREPRYLAD